MGFNLSHLFNMNVTNFCLNDAIDQFPGIDIEEGDTIALVSHFSGHKKQFYVSVNFDLSVRKVAYCVLQKMSSVDYMIESTDVLLLKNRMERERKYDPYCVHIFGVKFPIPEKGVRRVLGYSNVNNNWRKCEFLLHPDDEIKIFHIVSNMREGVARLRLPKDIPTSIDINSLRLQTMWHNQREEGRPRVIFDEFMGDIVNVIPIQKVSKLQN